MSLKPATVAAALVCAANKCGVDPAQVFDDVRSAPKARLMAAAASRACTAMSREELTRLFRLSHANLLAPAQLVKYGITTDDLLDVAEAAGFAAKRAAGVADRSPASPRRLQAVVEGVAADKAGLAARLDARRPTAARPPAKRRRPPGPAPTPSPVAAAGKIPESRRHQIREALRRMREAFEPDVAGKAPRYLAFARQCLAQGWTRTEVAWAFNRPVEAVSADLEAWIG